MSGKFGLRLALAFRSPPAPSEGERNEELLKELEELKCILRGGKGKLGDRLGPLSASIARLVEQLPLEDPLGLGERLLGALADLSAAVGSIPAGKRGGGAHRTRARAAAAEAGYLASLCQEFRLGRPEQVDSTIGRVEAVAVALR